jgi:hypothetical protein
MTHSDDPAIAPAPDAIEDRFELLSNARRRLLLYELYRSKSAVDVDDLSGAVAAAERHLEARTGTRDRHAASPARNGPTVRIAAERRRVHASLVGTHLPRLAAAGLVDYDGRTVALPAWTSHAGVFGTGRVDVPWARYYATVAAAVWTLIAVTVANVPPFALPWSLVAGLGVTVALAVSVAQYVTARRTPAAPFVTFESLVE